MNGVYPGWQNTEGLGIRVECGSALVLLNEWSLSLGHCRQWECAAHVSSGLDENQNRVPHVKIFCRSTEATYSYDGFVICGFVARMATSLRVFGKSMEIQPDSALDLLPD